MLGGGRKRHVLVPQNLLVDRDPKILLSGELEITAVRYKIKLLKLRKQVSKVRSKQ